MSVQLARFSKCSAIVEPTEFETLAVSKFLSCLDHEESEKASTMSGSGLSTSEEDASSVQEEMQSVVSAGPETESPQAIFPTGAILPTGPAPVAGKQFHTRLFLRGQEVIARMNAMGFGPEPETEAEKVEETPATTAIPSLSWLDQGLNKKIKVSAQTLRSI